MKNNSSLICYLFLMIFLTNCAETREQAAHGNHNEIQWYTYPAKYWNSQGLHIGNGSIGATFYGGIEQEKLSITEKSIWRGGPFRGDWKEIGVNPGAKESLPKIRKAIVENRVHEADRMIIEDFLGDNQLFGNFSSIGDLTFTLKDQQKATHYRRSLDLSNSLGKVEYEIGDIHYQREYFCSYPDNMLVMKMDASGEKKLTVTVGGTVIQDQYQITTSENKLEIAGEVDGNGRPFLVSVIALNNGGEIVASGSTMEIKAANSITFLIAISTNYKLEYPEYVGESPQIRNKRSLDNALKTGYKQLKQRHIEDYQNLYQRVTLDLNGDLELEKLPTNERWERMRKGFADPGLKEMAFNLGRYMVISSSRPGTLPANLQGGWNVYDVAPWAGNYQSNINIQEIYWPCGPTNLLECHEPWLNWIADLVKPGREIAQRVYGTDGWVSHTTGNIWGHVASIGGLSWGMYPMGSAWHCQHLWDQYTFNQDMDYLKNMAYPIMKEAAVFYFQNMVPFKGYLISAPTVSAEHGPFDPSITDNIQQDVRRYGNIFSLPGAYQDIEMLWDLFTNVAEAATLLGENDFADSARSYREQLLPLKIGQHGQLQEWYQDVDDPNSHHRHIAHLYAVAPGRQIHPTTTPQLAEAARQSLNMRGDVRFEDDAASGGNWSRAHRIASWTRLMDGNRANKIFTEMLANEGFKNLLTFQHASWSSGRPDLHKENDSTFLVFQLDASGATPAFMAEMLLQSHMGEIHLLPALPDEWPSGAVSGLLARGGFELNISWENGELKTAQILSTAGNKIPPIRVGRDLIHLPDDRIQLLNE